MNSNKNAATSPEERSEPVRPPTHDRIHFPSGTVHDLEACANSEGGDEEVGKGGEDNETNEEVDTPALPTPATPTKEEVERHRLQGHARYRPWCSHCVATRAREERSPQTTRGERATSPELGLREAG